MEKFSDEMNEMNMNKVVAINPNMNVMNMAEKQQTYDEIILLLDQIINDRTVPKNIRKAAEDSKAILSGSESGEVKISTAISILDEITNDPNMPMYTRTQIWNAVSMLEQKRREL
jgi:hypothetical protein